MVPNKGTARVSYFAVYLETSKYLMDLEVKDNRAQKIIINANRCVKS